MADNDNTTAGPSSASDAVSNTVRMYQDMDEHMVKRHRTGTKEGRAEAEDIARTLLSNADLPLVLRARSCMVLACSHDDGFVEWAKEAVRVAELRMSLTEGEPSPSVIQMLADCKKTLENAELDFAEGSRGPKKEESEDEEGQEDESSKEESQEEGK